MISCVSLTMKLRKSHIDSREIENTLEGARKKNCLKTFDNCISAWLKRWLIVAFFCPLHLRKLSLQYTIITQLCDIWESTLFCYICAILISYNINIYKFAFFECLYLGDENGEHEWYLRIGTFRLDRYDRYIFRSSHIACLSVTPVQ